MSDKLLPTVLHGADWTWIRLSGTIDRDVALASLIPEVRGARLLIDLVDLERLDSLGVRDWASWLAGVSAGRECVLVDCSPAAVAQLNLSSDFAASASVYSLVAPYYCETCDMERSAILEASALSTPPKAPELPCEACGTTMSFDDIESAYFSFLERVPAARPGPDTWRAMRAARSELGETPAIPLPPEPAPAPRIAVSPPEATPAEPPPAKSLSQSDMLFYVAVGVLTAILAMVVLEIASGP